MSLKTSMVRQFIRRLSPQDILDLTREAVREWAARMPAEERAAFLSRLVEENLGAALQGLGREERVALMNGMLPVVARYFPLEDVDILGAFADFSSPQTPDWDGL